MTHIVGKLDGVLQRLAEQRAMQHMPAQQPQYLGERMKQHRRASENPVSEGIADSYF